MPELSERLRAEVRDALAHRKISQREAADRATLRTGEQWSQGKVWKILNGTVELGVEELAVLAEVAGINLVELFREKGRDLLADLTPTELAIVQALRERPELGPALQAILGPPTKIPPGRRTIRERTRKLRRPW